MEMDAMLEAGIGLLILQSVMTLVNGDNENLGQDHRNYPITAVHSLYPTQLPELAPYYHVSPDTLRHCLEAAQERGIKIMIGLIADNVWWKYGWALPTPVREFGDDPALDSYWGRWVIDNAELSNKVAGEIWDIYGEEFADVIYGWYYYNEFWNFSPFDENVAKILAHSFNTALDFYSEITPGLPMAFSPFHNFNLIGAVQTGQNYRDIFALTRFREYDIFVPQDSVGGFPDRIPYLEPWMRAYRGAAHEAGIRFWVNNECFVALPGYRFSGAEIERLVTQLEITAPWAEKNITFSWNHYYSPIANDTRFHEDWIKYIRDGDND